MDEEQSPTAPAAPEPPFTRRVCAVLLVDVVGFSTLVGENAEQAARAVQNLQGVVQDIVRDAHGHAESRAGDAVLATFDSVADAVETALRILRRTATEDFNGLHLDVRMGAHFGDVLRREGNAIGDAINVAERLQRLAPPGALCVSSSVYRQVRYRLNEQFVDLGRRRLKNISYRVHAYLVAPRELRLPITRRSRQRMTWGIVAGALVVVAVADLTLRYIGRPAPPPEAAPVGFGVMLFKCHGLSSEDSWMCEAVRDGLNTQLSNLEGVKVYSKEFLDFLMSREGLSEIEAANRLGITKMLSGSLVAVDGTITIEIHVINVRTGQLEPSHRAEGPKKAFLDLLSTMALQVVAQLNLPLNDAERAALLAKRNTDVDAFKRLLDAEGVPSGPKLQPPRTAPELEPRSSLGVLGERFALLAPRPAAAAEESDAQQRPIIDVLERYRRAVEEKNLQALESIYIEFTPKQREAQEQYFANVRDLKITIDDIDVAVVRDEAAVSYTRTDDFVDVRTGRPIHVSVRATKLLRLENGVWKMVAGK